MRLFTVQPGMLAETERSVEAVVHHIGQLREAFEEKDVTLDGGHTYVLVFSPDDALNEVVSAILNTKKPKAKAS